MSKRDKLIQKIMQGKNISYDEAKKILLFFEYEIMNTCGSHVTFSKPGHQSITLVAYQKELKPYLIKKLQEALENE
jgi:predicted RNA binding protein YcfA (HicA-like mRNA interferase family)